MPATAYAEVVEGLGEVDPTVAVEDVSESATEDGTATATLGWSWPVSEQDWTYTSEATLRSSASSGRSCGSPRSSSRRCAPAGPSSRERSRRPRGEILGAGGQRLVTDRPVTRFGIDKSAVPPAGPSRRRDGSPRCSTSTWRRTSSG